MKNTIAKIGVMLSPVVAFLGVNAAHAASAITVPTSTATDFTATVSDTLADPGLLAVLVIAAALPVIFWVAKRLIGLVPKGR